MKVIYLHQYFKFPYESGGTRSFDLANGLLAFGHHIEVITSSSDIHFKTEKRWTKVEKNGLIIHYVYLPYANNMTYFQRSIAFFQFIWFSTLKLLSLKSDLVLATSTPLTIGIPAIIKKWVHKTPFIFEVRDVWPEAVIAVGAIKNKTIQKILFCMESIIYKNASAIVPLSSDMKASILLRYPKLARKPIQVIENISEINRFQNGYRKKVSVLKEKIGFKPRFTILYAGTFGYVNGIKYVIDLAHKLVNQDSSIVFILIGEGVEKNIILSKAKEKGVLNKNVFILDSVSKEDLPQLYFECDMGSSFVIPVKELWANSANKFFDTLAAGRPILINYEGWQKEVIIKENIGYVLPVDISHDEVQKFLLYSHQTSLIKEQADNALNTGKKNYSLDTALIKYNKIFKNTF
jgi:glycosyltransferase involved in cell wall biosynthesis